MLLVLACWFLGIKLQEIFKFIYLGFQRYMALAQTAEETRVAFWGSVGLQTEDEKM